VTVATHAVVQTVPDVEFNVAVTLSVTRGGGGGGGDAAIIVRPSSDLGIATVAAREPEELSRGSARPSSLCSVV